MGALGKLFGLAFGKIFFWFGTVLTGRVLLVAAAVSAFLVMLVGLNLLFVSLLATVSMAMPVEFQWGLGIIPTNIPACVSAIITARTALWIFQIKWAIVKVKVQG